MESEQEKKKRNLKSSIFEWVILAIVFLALLFLVPRFVFSRTIVYQESMEDTLMEGDNLFVEKVSRYFTNPKRFDIVIVKIEGEEHYVKRVIGLPGETVQIVEGEFAINGEKLTEHYGKEPISDPGIAGEPVVLGEDEFFVVGDNREVSQDSRSESIGPVSKKQIEGRVLFRVWPLNKFGVVN